MPFADTQDYIDRSILAAVSSLPTGSNPILSGDIPAEALVINALGALAEQIAQDPDVRHLLMKSTSVALDSNGQGDLDPSLLTQMMDRASVRDASLDFNNLGNRLVYIPGYNDFCEYLPSFYGYFCLHINKIHTRAVNSGSFFDTQGPLTVECSYHPTPVEVPEELEDLAVEILAQMILKVPVE